MGINKIILLGNLVKDPEVRATPGGLTVCRFSLATGERKKDQSGQWVDHTEWHNVVVFGKTAENCARFLKKGRQAFVEGRIRLNKWQDKEGKDRYTTEILAENVQFVGGGRGEGSSDADFSQEPANDNVLAGIPSADALPRAANSGRSAPAPQADEPVTFDDDDIPF
jgi:single-strand DNA-binding protein